jgi:hypothetical protein
MKKPGAMAGADAALDDIQFIADHCTPVQQKNHEF